jgi:hypothetical protein
MMMGRQTTSTTCRSAIHLLANAAFVLVLIGCVAIKEPRPNVIVSETERVALKHTVVGIIPPPLFIDTNRYEHDFEYRRNCDVIWESVRQFYAAENLLHRLQYIDVFQEVNYTNNLTCAPDVVLIPHESSFVGNDPYRSGAFLFVYSLGLFPINTYSDDGLYFSSVSQPRNNYSLRWKRTELHWWFSPILNMFPAWSRHSDGNAYKNAMIFYVLHNTTNIFTTALNKGQPNQAMQADGAAAPRPDR